MKDLDRIERELSQVSRRPAPSGLRDRTLSSALSRSAQRRFLSPAMRLLTAACVGLIIVTILIDSNLSQTQDQDRADLLGIDRSAQPLARPLSEDVFVEIFGEGRVTPFHAFVTKQYGCGDNVMKRKDYQRLYDGLERWENEI